MKKRFLLCLILINLKTIAQTTDTIKIKEKHFELSFGQSLLFISNSKITTIIKEEAIVIPTNAMLFLAEFRPEKYLRIPVFFNLATESKQFIINGQLLNERASPTVGFGIISKICKFKVDEKTKVELEAGPLMSILFDKKNELRIAPVFAGRIKILSGSNFIMYAGVSYSLGINALGLLYGTGNSF